MNASLAEPDQAALPLLRAIGQAVVAAAGLENALRLEINRLLYQSHGSNPGPTLSRDLAELEDMTGGLLLGELRELELPPDLLDRVHNAIKRRNRIVHHLHEDPDLARALGSGANMDVVIERTEQLATDCAELTVEFILVSIPAIEKMLGMPREAMIKALKSTDPTTIADRHDRARMEALQAFGDVTRLAGALDQINGTDKDTE